jgi:putative transposase
VKQSWFGSKKNLPHSVAERKLLIDRGIDLSLTRQAELLEISRASLYTEPRGFTLADKKLHRAVDRIYTQYPFYGQRKIRKELEDEYDIYIGRDLVRTVMRLLGLETLYPKPRTSDPHPGHSIFPYLLRRIKALFPNHIWSTDITYIPVDGGHCYLVAIIDWYSRYVLAWNVSPCMDTTFCVEALRHALATATPAFHNSDQGSQFTADDYIGVLKQYPDIKISMDGRGRCLDNVFVERLWRTVKYENVYLNDYRTIHDVREGLRAYFSFYNNERKHQSLEYQTPTTVYHQKPTTITQL